MAPQDQEVKLHVLWYKLTADDAREKERKAASLLAWPFKANRPAPLEGESPYQENSHMCVQKINGLIYFNTQEELYFSQHRSQIDIKSVILRVNCLFWPE